MTYEEWLEKHHNDAPMTYDELMVARVKSYNEERGNLKYLDCEVCRNKGHIMIVRSDESGMLEECIVECKCMERRRLMQKAESSGLGKYLRTTFTDYQCDSEFQQDVKHLARQYVKDGGKNWFVMLGQSGSGKTLISSIVANQLIGQGKDVLYITWTDFIGEIKRGMMSDDNKEAVGRYLNRVKTCEVLFIDELLKKYNETDLKYIIEIINYRYNNNLVTLITSERHINALLDIDEATFGRVIEKSGGYIKDIQNDRNKNFRLKGLI